MRALGEGGGLYSELATAAARWRPRGRLWARLGAWHGRGNSSARKGGQWEAQAGRVEATTSRRWLGGGSPRWAGGALHSGGENRAKELEEGEKDLNEISEISRDQTAKQR